MRSSPAGSSSLAAGLSLLSQGAGCVNAAGAVEVAQKINASAPVGASWLKAPLSKQSNLGFDAHLRQLDSKPHLPSHMLVGSRFSTSAPSQVTAIICSILAISWVGLALLGF